EATREGSSDEPDASAEGKAKSSRPTRRITAAWYPVPPQSLAKRRAPDEFTAAHNNLPLGTRVRVTNPDNGRTLIVRITDRGIRDRRVKLDVCKEAAVELGIVREGFADLKMEVLRDEEEPQRAAASQTVASGNDQSRNSE
ncbi:MAG TPA: septal ring lytic transglycosylase RlpA family protein, partial [Chthoniobacterales bacterium]